MTTTTTSSPSVVIAVAEPAFTNADAASSRWVPGRLHRPDPRRLRPRPAPVRQLVQQHHVRPFDARRADIECFARELEARGRARATVTRRLCTLDRNELGALLVSAGLGTAAEHALISCSR